MRIEAVVGEGRNLTRERCLPNHRLLFFGAARFRQTNPKGGEDMSEPQMSSDVAVVGPPDVDSVKQPDLCQPLAMRSFGLTDRGRVRPANEDQFLIAALLKALQVELTSLPQPKVQCSSNRSYLLVVADGMGGHAGGEKASALAMETFKWFAQFKAREEDQVLADFQRALGQANARILAEAAERPELHGMGTTLTLAYSLNDELFVAHVGDSRCYLSRNRALHRLTSDHTLVEEMISHGALSAEEAVNHRWRHVITNVVGGDDPKVRVELHKVHLEAGDVVLLCSDGLTEMLSEAEIGRILQTEADPERACRLLVDRANEAGGRDNITVVVAQFHDANQEETLAHGQEFRRQRIGRAESVAATVLSRTGQGALRPSQPVLASPASR